MSHDSLSLGIAFIGAAVLSAFLATLLLRRWARRFNLLDIPNERSLHSRPTSRGGGASFLVVLVLAALSFCWLDMPPPRGITMWFLGSFLIASVSLADDRLNLPVLLRLMAHAAGALILMAGAGWIREIALPGGTVLSLGWMGLPLTFMWIVGLINAYNFMDGIDGMAAGQAVVVAAVMACIGRLQGAETIYWAMAITAGAAAGFLPHNWPPAKIFMGDIGSAFLGFNFAAWALLSGTSVPKPLPFLAWVTALSPVLLDTGVTLVSRVLRGKHWYEAHCDHFYQRLVRRGWSHLAVTGLYACATALIGLAAIAFYGYGAISPVLFIAAVLLPLFGIVILVRRVENRTD